GNEVELERAPARSVASECGAEVVEVTRRGHRADGDDGRAGHVVVIEIAHLDQGSCPARIGESKDVSSADHDRRRGPVRTGPLAPVIGKPEARDDGSQDQDRLDEADHGDRDDAFDGRPVRPATSQPSGRADLTGRVRERIAIHASVTSGPAGHDRSDRGGPDYSPNPAGALSGSSTPPGYGGGSGRASE